TIYISILRCPFMIMCAYIPSSIKPVTAAIWCHQLVGRELLHQIWIALYRPVAMLKRSQESAVDIFFGLNKVFGRYSVIQFFIQISTAHKRSTDQKSCYQI